jgi:hypothetical protein
LANLRLSKQELDEWPIFRFGNDIRVITRAKLGVAMRHNNVAAAAGRVRRVRLDDAPR